MIRRGTEPDRGRWSLPGGRVETGETDEEATVREVLEETGLDVEVVGAAVGGVELPLPSGAVAAVVDFVCRPAADADLDAVRAGDDADDARWFTPAEVLELDCSPGLVDTLDDWGFLRRS
ncbi:MAG: NUDIX domain-containing protein [Nocardioidaceae bacterium]|nr:NUDIX domain-containing protein [Nocardioidaceae bacterium]